MFVITETPSDAGNKRNQGTIGAGIIRDSTPLQSLIRIIYPNTLLEVTGPYIVPRCLTCEVLTKPSFEHFRSFSARIQSNNENEGFWGLGFKGFVG